MFFVINLFIEISFCGLRNKAPLTMTKIGTDHLAKPSNIAERYQLYEMNSV